MQCFSAKQWLRPHFFLYLPYIIRKIRTSRRIGKNKLRQMPEPVLCILRKKAIQCQPNQGLGWNGQFRNIGPLSFSRIQIFLKSKFVKESAEMRPMAETSIELGQLPPVPAK